MTEQSGSVSDLNDDVNQYRQDYRDFLTESQINYERFRIRADLLSRLFYKKFNFFLSCCFSKCKSNFRRIAAAIASWTPVQTPETKDASTQTEQSNKIVTSGESSKRIHNEDEGESVKHKIPKKNHQPTSEIQTRAKTKMLNVRIKRLKTK